MIKRHNPSERMSQAVRHGGLIYLSGQVPAETDGDIAAQTTSVLEKIDALLGEMSATRANVLSATIYLTSMEHFASMNEVWDKWFAAGEAPARTCVEARLARPTVLVEITVIAADRESQ